MCGGGGGGGLVLDFFFIKLNFDDPHPHMLEIYTTIPTASRIICRAA